MRELTGEMFPGEGGMSKVFASEGGLPHTPSSQYLFYGGFSSIWKFQCCCLHWLSFNPLPPCFHWTAYDYSVADLDSLLYHLRNVLVSAAAATDFCGWCSLELLCIPLIINIRSSLLHLYGFHLFQLLP